MTIDYDEDSFFCSDCTEDYWLKVKIGMHGTRSPCSICENEDGIAVSFETLASWLENIWREWFRVGDDKPAFYGDSDKIQFVQSGDEPELLLGELIKCRDDEAVVRSLISLMSRGDQYEVMHGGDVLIDECMCYQRRQIQRSLLDDCWQSFVLDLKHHTRYFNNRAIGFFDQLFEDLNEVETFVTSDRMGFQHNKEKQSVIRKFEPGSLPIFRARKVGHHDVQLKIIKDPETELSNPPDRLAAEGRMNPKGISYFYGAEDRDTCVAELRPSLSERAISAEFQLIEPVQLLDMTLLAEGRHARPDSLFDDNYKERRIHRELLRQLQWLIAQPVVSGADLEYLPTQAMAEYLARRKNPRIDGIIFESVQRKGGRNVVLFPHVLNKENHSATDFINPVSVIQLKPNTLVIHDTTEVEYRFKLRRVVNGNIEILPEDYDAADDYYRLLP